MRILQGYSEAEALVQSDDEYNEPGKPETGMKWKPMTLASLQIEILKIRRSSPKVQVFVPS